MIARVWTATSEPEDAERYADHLVKQVIPELQTIDGYVGAMLLERRADDVAELVVMTWWNSFDSISAFAGPDIEGAVVADDAAALLVAFDSTVRHYSLVVADGAPPSV